MRNLYEARRRFATSRVANGSTEYAAWACSAANSFRRDSSCPQSPFTTCAFSVWFTIIANARTTNDQSRLEFSWKKWRNCKIQHASICVFYKKSFKSLKIRCCKWKMEISLLRRKKKKNRKNVNCSGMHKLLFVYFVNNQFKFLKIHCYGKKKWKFHYQWKK